MVEPFVAKKVLFDENNAFDITSSSKLAVFQVATAMSSGYTNIILTKKDGVWTMNANTGNT